MPEPMIKFDPDGSAPLLSYRLRDATSYPLRLPAGVGVRALPDGQLDFHFASPLDPALASLRRDDLVALRDARSKRGPRHYGCIAGAQRHAPSIQTATGASGQTTTVNFTS